MDVGFSSPTVKISAGWPPLTLDRSVEGDNFRAYEELLAEGSPGTEAKLQCLLPQRRVPMVPQKGRGEMQAAAGRLYSMRS